MPFWTPRRQNRKYQRFTLEELKSRLEGRSAEQIFADIEKHGDGHVVPLSMIKILAASDGTLDYDTPGKYQANLEISFDDSDAAFHDHTVTAGKYWLVKNLSARNGTRSNTYRWTVSLDAGTSEVDFAYFHDSNNRMWQSYGSQLPPREFRLKATDRIRCYFGGRVAGDAVESGVWYEEYDS